MLKVKVTPPKVAYGKKTITVTDALVDSLVVFDENGDISDEIREAIPDGVDKVSFRIILDMEEDEE